MTNSDYEKLREQIFEADASVDELADLLVYVAKALAEERLRQWLTQQQQNL